MILGSIVVGDTSVRRRHCGELRKILHSQFPNLSGNFVFLSRDGWPIFRHQEGSVRACQVINDRNAIEIQRNFGNDKCRFAVLTQTNQLLGVISSDPSAPLQKVRETISEQLKDVKTLGNDYQFTERSSWPVQSSQECQMVLSDVWTNDSIILCLNSRSSIVEHRSVRLSSVISEIPNTDEIDQVIKFREPPLQQCAPSKRKRDTLKQRFMKKVGGGNQAEITSATDLCNGKKKGGLVAKPILISYVRAEAADHAMNLKKVLESHKYSVYLDVHEIGIGNDWQDSLNFAVSNCTVFVPLITPQYGMTQWTNREVKLADVLNKFIVPVNFLENWPPECLAIQFATTQYISWKSNLDHGAKESDYRVWEPQYISQVASDIIQRFTVMFDNKDSHQKLRHTVKRKDTKFGGMERSSLYALDNLGSIIEEGSEDEQSSNNFVVISAHPKDIIFAEQAKRFLTEKGYKVWSSIQLLEENCEDVFMSGSPLTPIPEGETFTPRFKQPLSRVDTDINPEKRGLCRLSSQMSTIGAMTVSLTPEKIERLTTFQTKADQAGVVVILLSKAFTMSSTSLQQIFYCEHRKKVVLLKTDNEQIPSKCSMLIGNEMLTTVDNPDVLNAMLKKVKRCFNNTTSHATEEDKAEAKMQYLVKFMKKNLKEFQRCVYIAGSSKLQNKRSEEICDAIGHALAKIKDVNVVTGGFFGAGDIAAKAFETDRQNEDPVKYANEPVVHILPVRDSKDFSQKATQNKEGDFEPSSYGKTVFLGDSVKERESAVARLFDICIVVEGGPGAAHEVEEFIWNDHFVIPIISSGGAASGQFGAPLKILEAPPSVCKDDWSVLSEKGAEPKQVADAVANIVKSIKAAVAEHAKKEADKPKQISKKARRRSRKSRKKRDSTLQPVVEADETSKETKPAPQPVEIISDPEDDYVSDSMCTGTNRWQKFWKIFKPPRLIS